MLWRICGLLILVGACNGAQAQSSGRGDPYGYLSGEQYSPYAYQRPAQRKGADYGYDAPAYGRSSPYNSGERYSPYAYGSRRGED